MAFLISRNRLFNNVRPMLSPAIIRFNSTVTSHMDNLGISGGNIFHNLSNEDLTKHYAERKEKEGRIVETPYGKVQSVDTGKYTGRSPKDKWIVDTPSITNDIWWGSVNQATTSDVFDDIYVQAQKQYKTLDSYYVFDGLCGSSSTKKVRFVTEYAWQHHFVKNMFVESPTAHDEKDLDFTIVNACNVLNDRWEEHGLHSDVFVGFHLDRKLGLIGGTHYGGEMKKGIFALMNYWLPKEKVMTMHCSANIGKEGDTVLFFGLSGTGKTTLSADPVRQLIGDDEHGWDDTGIFNFEGGCYAKTHKLAEETEPDIFRAVKPNALLENIWINEDNTPDYNNTTKTENGRVSYPIQHIKNFKTDLKGNHPEHIIFLTCDAFGVLPPVSKLDHEQAMYYFLSGYTAKVAGTERGLTEPEATFSACFGAAFLPLHPTVYADLLLEKLNTHDSQVWLINTGWSGGGYGEGERMSIQTTRSCLDAILGDKLGDTTYTSEPYFNLSIPSQVPDVDSKLLNPINTWDDKDKYDGSAKKLVQMFKDNYGQFLADNRIDYSVHGPQ